MGKHPLYNKSGLQKNNKSHVMYALSNKQMELKQIQDEYEAKILKVKADLEAMEQVICLFDGDCNKTIKKLNTKSSNTIPKKRNKYFIKGECKKLILTILRTATEPLKSDEITTRIIKMKKLEDEDFIKIQKSILAQLKFLEENNLAYKFDRVGLNYLWKIKNQD